MPFLLLTMTATHRQVAVNTARIAYVVAIDDHSVIYFSANNDDWITVDQTYDTIMRMIDGS